MTLLGRPRTIALLAALVLLVPLPASGQGARNPWPTGVSSARTSSPGTGFRWAAPQEGEMARNDGSLTFLGTAKWATLAVSAGAAVYGFSLNSQADDIFDRLDEICLEDPDRCTNRNPDDSFTDEELEAMYQETLSKDRQARTALIVSQVALAASVLFFIMDLSNASPPNVPFDPSVTFEVGPTRGGTYVIGARVPVGPGRGAP